ncbi:MAG: orotate phosphoribosyltransferase [Anaerolineae bacterium]|nr:orotate phosphoribosyltransferase [Anaerolineae bacterium]
MKSEQAMSGEALQAAVARALLEIRAVVFTPRQPVTFKSGIQSPVYVDNRRLPFWPDQWRLVIEGFQGVVAAEGLAFDVVTGIAAAGIPHSAALAYALAVPSVFVRKEPKGHGLKSQIEGGDVRGRRVLLVEDLVTTGGSSLAGVAALRDAGATVTDALCITSYGFPEAEEAFQKAGVRLHPLTPFTTIAEQARAAGYFGEPELGLVRRWLDDPHGWLDSAGGEA